MTVGALLVAAGVAGEWLAQPQASDGSVTNPLTFALLVGVSTVGALLLTVAVWQLRRSRVRRTRPARAGAVVTATGTGLLLASFTAVLLTGLVRGAPHGASFLPFLLGMLLLAVGPVTWGASLLRSAAYGGAGRLLVAAGVASFGSLALATDPWHDLALMAMLAAWAATGVALRRTARSVDDAAPLRMSAIR
jgi:hypothetical protein